MEEIETIEAKHIFIDIVNYTHNRSVEAQSDIIKVLNEIVSISINHHEIEKDNLIFIPTGDGMCISLVNILSPYDIHLQVCLTLLEKLKDYNGKQLDSMRKFSIRIGVNENIDNLIIDINGRKNISGSGINTAARIEGLADENQILVGRSVYDKLVSREKYMKSFEPYTATVKHGLQLNIYQYRDLNKDFINNGIPSLFKPQIIDTIKRKNLTIFEAFYIANCLENYDFIISKVKNSLDASALHSLIYIKTLDNIAEMSATKTGPGYVKRAEGNNDEFFKLLKNSNVWLNHEVRYTLLPLKLSDVTDCFSENFLIVNNFGKDKLKNDHFDIFTKLLIDVNTDDILSN